MTNQEIDFQLALAIGWQKNHMQLDGNGNVFLLKDGICGKYWRLFCHTRPDVIWPIAERFNAFPERCFDIKCVPTGWRAWAKSVSGDEADNPATATALAVIEHCKKGPP